MSLSRMVFGESRIATFLPKIIRKQYSSISGSSDSSSNSSTSGDDTKPHYQQLTVYNSLSKKKEPLVLRNDNTLYWYSCGPTVYDSAHIGHACSYVNFDIIKRILTKYFRINVVNLLNITDIDDKIIRKSIQEKKNFREITEKYEKEFLSDLASLNCERPSIVLRVTRHVPDIVSFVQRLIDSNMAYATGSGSVYFDTQRFSVDSFFLPGETSQEFDSKENKEKRHPFDFALWKARKEANEPSWPSPWSDGRPGWHIECSTLATLAFGQHLDIHSGGKDLIFPHHHNEMIQCCAYFGASKWASLWLHTGHLHLKNDAKMSKSLSNTVSIRDFLQKYTHTQFRFFCLLSPYRNDKEFSDEKMQKPMNLCKSFESFLEFCQAYCNERIGLPRPLVLDESSVFEKLQKTRQRVHSALCDDFDTCAAIEELAEFVAFMNRQFQPALDTSHRSDSCEATSAPSAMTYRHYGCVMSVANYVETTLDLFGIAFGSAKRASQANSDSADIDINSVVEAVVKFRNSIRSYALSDAVTKENKKQLFAYCDQIRNELQQLKIELKDHQKDTIWKQK